MRLTIVVPDNAVFVDGKMHQIDCSAFPTVHAVQWDGSSGTVEYISGPPEVIEDISPYQPLLDAWTAAESYVPPPPSPPTISDLIAYANKAQWKKATGGYTTTINGQSVTFATTSDSMALINGKFARFQQPNAPASVDWQVSPTEFVTLTAADFNALAINIADFVQATFDKLPQLIADINSGAVTTTAQIDQVFATI